MSLAWLFIITVANLHLPYCPLGQDFHLVHHHWFVCESIGDSVIDSHIVLESVLMRTVPPENAQLK